MVGLLDLPVEILQLIFDALEPRREWQRDAVDALLQLRGTCRCLAKLALDHILLLVSNNKLPPTGLARDLSKNLDLCARVLFEDVLPLADDCLARQRNGDIAFVLRMSDFISGFVADNHPAIYVDRNRYLHAICVALVRLRGYGNLRRGRRPRGHVEFQLSEDDNSIYTNIALAAAAKIDDVPMVELLLSKGANPNCNEGILMPGFALLLATISGSLATAKLLLYQPGCVLYKGQRSGITLLHGAARTGRAAVVQLLLDHPDVDMNARDAHKRTPLWVAARRGHVEVVKLLLGREGIAADVNANRKPGDTPLMAAAGAGHEEVVALLMDREDVDVNCINDAHQTPLLHAMCSRRYTVVKRLLASPKTNINVPDKQSAMKTAISLADKLLVELVLTRKDLDINAACWGQTPVVSMLRLSMTDLIPRVVERSDFDRHTPEPLLNDAAKFGVSDTVKLLIERYHFPVNSKDQHRQTSLLIAAQNGFEEIAKFLAGRDDVDADAWDFQRRTPLSWAAELSESIETVKILLERKDVDPNRRDSEGLTPLSYAVSPRVGTRMTPRWPQSTNAEVVKCLLDCDKVDRNIPDKDGRTPLARAVRRSAHIGTVKMLLARNDVDAGHKDIDGVDILGLAMQGRNFEVIRLLVDRDDVDISSENHHGFTPAEFAETWGEHELAAYIRAKIDAREGGGCPG